MADKKVTCNTTLCLLLLLLLIRECRQKVAGEGMVIPHPPKLMNRRPERSEVCVTGVLQDTRRNIIKHLTRHPIHHPKTPNSQILAEFQSVCAKSPGVEEGRAWTSFTLLVSGVFEVEMLVKKGEWLWERGKGI